MTKPLRHTCRQLAVARDDKPESFADFAFKELAAAPLVEAGICKNPYCSKHFAPSRTAQQFCCEKCERQHVSEMRRWGLRLAPALIASRATKYAKAGSPEAELRRAADSYRAQALTLWHKGRETARLQNLELNLTTVE